MMILEIHWDFSAVGVQGWTIFIIGWLVVFISLILLSSVFRLLPKFMKFIRKQNLKSLRKQPLATKKTTISQSDFSSDNDVSGELTAAIAMALHMYFNELHDDEARILKVEHKSRKYSPWNSKIYNIMDFKR